MTESKSQARSGAARPRWVVWAIVAIVAVLVLAAGIVFYTMQTRAGELVGGALADPPSPAANFTLTDQFGKQVSLASLRGKPVAMTFIYTNCPDVCPIISANMHRAYDLLGNRGKDVALVAVTVDPERDTVEQVHSFSDRLGLTDQWSFLTGDRPQLEQVWASYGIFTQKAGAAAQAQNQPAPTDPDAIEHAAPVFLIDKKGIMRAMLPTDVTSDDLATDLRVLLAER